MKALKLKECSAINIVTQPDGFYLIDGNLIASITNGTAVYFVNIVQPEVLDIDETHEQKNGSVSEDFALKIAAMAFERDSVPRNKS